MNFIYQVLGYPLGWIMWALYGIVRNYGVALLLFTILAKLALLPISLKQQKSSAKMMALQPQINDLQSKYKNNKEKLNEEMMKLYQKEKYNPMSGCLPMLIQFPVLFGLIDVIYKPLFHILRLSQETIDIGQEILSKLTGTPVTNGLSYAQLDIIRGVQQNASDYMAMGAEAVEKIQGLNLIFLGMDLTQRPSMSMFGEIFTNFNPVILIPILSGVSSLLLSLQSTKQQAATNPGAGGGGMKGMMLMMPIFSTWIAFSVPAGVGLYWFYSNLTSMVQTWIMNKKYNPKEIAEKARLEQEQRQEQERLERLEAKKKLKEAAAKGEISQDELPKEALSQKELNRRKLAEARKRDAEKYGEEYVDVTDEDLV